VSSGRFFGALEADSKQRPMWFQLICLAIRGTADEQDEKKPLLAPLAVRPPELSRELRRGNNLVAKRARLPQASRWAWPNPGRARSSGLEWAADSGLCSTVCTGRLASTIVLNWRPSCKRGSLFALFAFLVFEGARLACGRQLGGQSRGAGRPLGFGERAERGMINDYCGRLWWFAAAAPLQCFCIACAVRLVRGYAAAILCRWPHTVSGGPFWAARCRQTGALHSLGPPSFERRFELGQSFGAPLLLPRAGRPELVPRPLLGGQTSEKTLGAPNGGPLFGRSLLGRGPNGKRGRRRNVARVGEAQIHENWLPLLTRAANISVSHALLAQRDAQHVLFFASSSSSCLSLLPSLVLIKPQCSLALRSPTSQLRPPAGRDGTRTTATTGARTAPEATWPETSPK